MLFLVVLAFGQADARSPVKAAALISDHHKINPPLEDVSSDKKFFGPPFPADYPDDKRPSVDKKLLGKLRGPDQPYPALQSKADYDTDYVKDENSDKGHWKAQFEYDALRKKLNKETGDEKAAEDAANREGKDVDDAQKKRDDAAKKAADAAKDADDAAKSGDETGNNGDKGKDGKDGKDGDGKTGGSTGDPDMELVPPSEAELEKLKKRVTVAEESYEKEKKQFEECQKKLEEAKKNVEELKARQAEMEAQLASETKLYMETKVVKLNLKHAKEDAASAKRLAAEARLKEAQTVKQDLDLVLAAHKAKHDKAQQALAKEKADVEKAKADLAKATLHLQKLRGYSPEAPTKSGAQTTSALSVFAFVAVQALL